MYSRSQRTRSTYFDDRRTAWRGNRTRATRTAASVACRPPGRRNTALMRAGHSENMH